MTKNHEVSPKHIKTIIFTSKHLEKYSFNDRSTTTCRRVNLHVGVTNHVIPNNEQIAKA